MPKSTPDNDRRSLWIGMAGILLLTVWRIALLPLSTADLFVDEAQYWQWGQSLEFGYYSKPPLIGWVIRAFTELGDSDAPFWIRLPGPLFHAATALIVLATARRLWGNGAGAATGIAYATLPAVSLGSFLISTDTILMPFFALALHCYLRLAERRSVALALFMGASLGLGMMAKYAAIYFLLGAGLGAVFVREARIAPRDAALAGLAFLLVFAPNIVWNLQNGLTTLAHTADNIDWVNNPSQRMKLNFAGLGEFFGGQFAVMGPVFFAAYLVIVWRTARSRAAWEARWLIWMSLPIIALVCVQALLSRAYANWAAPAYVAAIILTASWLWARSRAVFWAGLAINLGLALAFPVTLLHADSWTVRDRLVLGRYTDRAATSARILDLARAQGLHDVVADSRDLLADLFHAAKGSGIAIHSVPFPDHPPHYYAQRHPYPDGRRDPALAVFFGDTPPDCRGGSTPAPVARWIAGPGAYRGNVIRAYRVGPGCWTG